MIRNIVVCLALMLLCTGVAHAQMAGNGGGGGAGGGGGGAAASVTHNVGNSGASQTLSCTSGAAQDIYEMLGTAATAITLHASSCAADQSIILVWNSGAGGFTPTVAADGASSIVNTGNYGQAVTFCTTGGLQTTAFYLFEADGKFHVMSAPTDCTAAPTTPTASGIDASTKARRPVAITSLPDSSSSPPPTNGDRADVYDYNGSACSNGAVATGNGGGGTSCSVTYNLATNQWIITSSNPMTANGDLIMGSSGGAPTRLAGNITTTPEYPQETGTGAAANQPTWSQIADADLAFTDIGTNNVSTAKHGFAPKLDNVATHFLNGQGGYTTPAVAANPALSTTNSVTGTAGSAQAVVFEDAPALYHYLGDGAEADPAVFVNANCTGSGTPVACCTGSGTGTCASTQTIQGFHNYANLTVGAGATLTVGSAASSAASPQDEPPRNLIVRSTGTCTIAGTIAANAICSANVCGGGGSGGSGGSGAANSSAGNNSDWGVTGNTVTGIVLVAGGLASSSGAGNAGASPTTASQLFVRADPFTSVLGGAPGSGGGSSGGAAGVAGGGVVLMCNAINFTGTVNAAGGNGSAGGSSTGGGGGGGGGVIITAARSYTANSGALTVTHGNGGGAGTGTTFAGANGGDGWSKQYTLN